MSAYVRSEEHELLADVADDFVGGDLEEVEVDGLGEGPALADDGDIADLDAKGGRAVGGDVAVAFFVTVVLGHVVQVVAPDDDGALHLGGDDDALEDLAADSHSAGEGAFLIDVVALDGLLGSSEAQTHVLVIPHASRGLLGQQFLAVEEHVVLLLERALSLNYNTTTWMSAIVNINILINKFRK
jgi:hypothetical protein